MRSIRFSSILIMLVLLLSMAGISAQADHTHKWGAWSWMKTDTAKTCGNYYTQERHCTVSGCNARETRRTKYNHSWSDWDTVDATCTETGKQTRKCNRCGKTQWETIDALGHDWGEWYVLYEPVGATPGMEEHCCRRCGISEQREIPGTQEPVLPEEQHPALSVQLISASSPSAEGDTVTTVWRITNTGDTDLCFTATRFLDGDGSWDGSAASQHHAGEDTGYMKPGAWTEKQVTFTVSANDAQLCQVIRTYTAICCVAYPIGQSPDGYTFSDTQIEASASVNLPLDAAYSLAVEKTVISTAVDPSGAYAEGEQVEYRIIVTNPNSVPVTGVQVYDFLIIGQVLGQFDSLDPGESVSVTVTYYIQEEDADYGQFTNQAVARGFVGDQLVEGTDEVVVHTLPRVYRIEGSLIKTETSVPPADGYYGENDVITYAITLTNNSKFSWDSVEFYDSQVGGVIAVANSMDPGESVTVSHSYPVSASDAENSTTVYNTAYAYVTVGDRHRNFTSNTVVSLCGSGITPEPPFEPAGEDCCERVLTACSEGGFSYELHFCAAHAPTQAYELQMLDGIKDPALRANCYTLATASRQTEAEALYDLILARSGSGLKSAVLREKLDFTAMMANFTAMANILYADEPDTAAWLVYRMWENQVVDLCRLLNKGGEARCDLMSDENGLDITPGSMCAFEVTAADERSEAYTDALCAAHTVTNRLCLNVAGAFDAGWKSADMTWQQSEKILYGNLLNGKTLEQRQIMAETCDGFETWLTAQSELLSFFYPDTTVTQLAARSRMEWVMNLCK